MYSFLVFKEDFTLLKELHQFELSVLFCLGYLAYSLCPDILISNEFPGFPNSPFYL